MRNQRRYRFLTCALCIVVAAAACLAFSPPLAEDGPIFDVIVWLRSIVAPPADPANSPVAVIAIDRRSLDSPELARYPRALLEPILATTVAAVLKAGARVVGFDEIFAYNPATLPGIEPNFAGSFLEVLHQNRSKIALTRTATMVPAPPFAFSVGYDGLGLAELPADADGPYRHVPAWGTVAGGRLPTLVNVVVSRAGATMPEMVLIAPRYHPERIPTYALVDVLRCAKDSPDVLANAFAGKIVLIGGTLPEEDRKETSGSLLKPTASDSPPVASCGLRMLGASNPQSQTVPGLFLHALAAQAVLAGDLVRTAPPIAVAILAALLAAFGAVVGLTLTPWSAAMIEILGVALTFAMATVALMMKWWIPIAIPLYALGGAPVVSYVARYLVEERTRRRVMRAFSHYLSPAIVQELAADDAALKLGGEHREVTVMFADLSGFTAMSGRVPPEVLIATVNRYLGYVVAEVEGSKGYVDKFVGDAVMAMWGAPVRDSNDAVNAVHCALRAAAAVARAQAEDRARGEAGFSIKIGINSGTAVVGNVGTEHRFAYTAHGEMVNLASRLEGVPPLYQCTVVIGARTAELAGDEFLLEELDWILVKGASSPMAIYQPIVERKSASPEQIARVERYADALKLYRAGRFHEAASVWEHLVSADPPSSANGESHDGPESIMARTARRFIASPPGEPWTAVNVLTTK